MGDLDVRRRKDVLARLALFQGFSPPDLEALARACGVVAYRKGDVVCRRGDPGDTFFVLAAGELEVWGGGEPERMIGRLGPGEFVGEMTLLLGGARTATVRVSRRATLLTLDKPSFDRFIGGNAAALEHLSRALCRRLLTTSRREVHARATTTIGVIAAPGLRGASLVAAVLGELLADMTGEPVLALELVADAVRPAPAVLALGVARGAPVDRLLARVAHGAPQDPARLALALGRRPADPSEDLIAILARLATRFPLIVVDGGAAPAAVRAVEESCDRVVAIVACPAPPATTHRHERTLEVIDHVNPASPVLPISHSEPFVVPLDRALVGLDVRACARRLRADPWHPVARPLHRLARTLLGRSVGIALGGGAAFGLAHVGVLQVLEANHIPLDMVAGASMGSIIALAHASGMRADEMATRIRAIATPWGLLSALDFTLTRPGLLAGDRLVRLMAPLFGDARTFADLRVPCRAVATDIEEGVRVTIGAGRVEDAFRASCAVPPVWAPVRHQGRVLVDGSVIDPVPAEVVREMGADLCIAVNVVPKLKRGVTTVLSRFARGVNRLNPLSYLGRPDLPTMFDTVMNSFQTLQHELGTFKALSADVLVTPDLSDLTWIEFHRPDELIARGHAAAEAALPDLRRLLAARPGTPRAPLVRNDTELRSMRGARDEARAPRA